MYTAILRYKQGERKALEKSSGLRECMRPLFVVEPQKISDLFSWLSGQWSGGTAAIDIADALPEDIGGQEVFITGVEQAVQGGVTVNLVWRPDAPVETESLVRTVAKETGVPVVSRVAIGDILDVADEALRISEDVIIDMGMVGEGDVKTMAALAAVAASKYGRKFKTMTLAGGSFPESVSNVPVGISHIPRYEWVIWDQVTMSHGELQYADYGSVSPETPDVDPSVMRPVAKIRFTHKSDWIIARGKMLHSSIHGGYAQFHSLALDLMNTPEYQERGPEFSEGARRISEVASSESGPGNLTTWVEISMNHHFHEICYLLSTRV